MHPMDEQNKMLTTSILVDHTQVDDGVRTPVDSKGELFKVERVALKLEAHRPTAKQFHIDLPRDPATRSRAGRAGGTSTSSATC